MKRLVPLLGVLVAVLLLVVPATGQRLYGSLSDLEIAIHSAFTGETLTLFGTVEPDAEGMLPEGPYEVVVVVRGPVADRVTRLKTLTAGLWLNTEQAYFERLPSYFHTFTTRRIVDVARPEVVVAEGLTPHAQARAALVPGTSQGALFVDALVRLMTERGLFGLHETGVVFRSPTLYSVHITLPGDVPNGRFLAQTFLLKDGEIVSRKADSFIVRKDGIERFLYAAARDQPLLYGLACTALALFTGWLGGVVFRR